MCTPMLGMVQQKQTLYRTTLISTHQSDWINRRNPKPKRLNNSNCLNENIEDVKRDLHRKALPLASVHSRDLLMELATKIWKFLEVELLNTRDYQGKRASPSYRSSN